MPTLERVLKKDKSESMRAAALGPARRMLLVAVDNAQLRVPPGLSRARLGLPLALGRASDVAAAINEFVAMDELRAMDHLQRL